MRGQSFAEVEKKLRADGHDETTVAAIMPIVINEMAEAYRTTRASRSALAA